ncbi:MAG TPA: DNA polymerase III subunit gamma/tau [Burkholderiales bacterium]|nr:DNA polymerase III subunit gamma/tau [Burkholderiales bacterium]
MTYQVLARKWRPRSFETLVGQEHVVKALTHALSSGRLHHAYLFTGTRGVGKTTIARILAKALNCEKNGISPKPCGECAACTEIDNGRYVDYIEMDAASYRGVEDMVDLLERAAYAPSSGRYKVYMIDEVHQLSNHAFNAMLKTLEEPPAHILFILATTDPQKVPVTVLSRCLQFNLKQLPPAEIAGQLERILKAESIPAEPGGLRLIANGARGSMRDALSLMDQAIAYSGGQVGEQAVRAMLGTIDDSFLYAILEALAAGDAKALLDVAGDMDARNLSFDGALQELAALLHLVALAQTAPEAVPTSVDAARVKKIAAALDAEDVQLYYQIAIHARQDLPLAPDEYAGFSMALLRMLAFKPETAGSGTTGPEKSPPGTGGQRANREPARAPLGVQAGVQAAIPSKQSANVAAAGPAVSRPAMADNDATNDDPGKTTRQPAKAIQFKGNWADLTRNLDVGGVARQLARQSELKRFESGVLDITVPPSARHLLQKAYLDKLASALEQHFGAAVRLNVEVAQAAGTSAQDQAVAAINQDQFVHELLDQFDGSIVDSSIQPISAKAEQQRRKS